MNGANQAIILMHIMPFDFRIPETAFQRKNEKCVVERVRKANYKFTWPIVRQRECILWELVNHNPMKVKRYNSFVGIYLF